MIHVLDPRLPGIAHLDSYSPCRFLADLGDLLQWTSSQTSLLSETKNSILVVVDRLTKMAHFTPCSKSIMTEETAQLILDGIVRLHGLPEEIVSDRGPQFASKFWRRLFELLGVDIRLSSAFHLKTNGQTERTNQTLEQYLHCTVNYQHDDWLALLSQAEFAYNNTTHASTEISPFFANYGFHRRFSLEIPGDSVNPSAKERATRLGQVH